MVAERDPVAALGLLSWVASWFDLLTLLYIGVPLSLTCPVVYVKQEGRIKGIADHAGDQGRRLGGAFDEKVTKRLRSRQPEPARVKKTYGVTPLTLFGMRFSMDAAYKLPMQFQPL